MVYDVNSCFRHIRRDERSAIVSLLHFLPILYPRGEEWLERKLKSCRQEQAQIFVGCVSGKIGGVLIETAKGNRCRKLSTLYVHPDYRHLGLASTMLNARIKSWERLGTESVHITFDASRENLLKPLLTKFGFRLVGREIGKYRNFHTELIYGAALGSKIAHFAIH